MPSSIIEAVPTMPLKAPARAKVNLIAWDPESPAHAERMVQQRVACGWKQDYIEQWRVLQRKGKMALQWVVLSEEDPEKESKLAQHLLKYPGEAAPILDSATALGGNPRVPSSQSFIPVGHISLNSETPYPDQADASKGIYCISTFYISRAIQGGGLGRATMDTLESEAVKEPLCAKVLSLDTLANNSANRSQMWVEIGMKPPALSNEDWYTRRGYEVYRFEEGHIKHIDPNGKVWPLDSVFMKKTVA
ncbi:Uncharacterized protein BP5553_02490 [Venustampulla echinocandica]|uniref:N-acetyltransferase domain-containing protein n=1 Tax=Venustampulla echinocandica TaxID=2656787 RepID=A0A370U402_9HELO|nr:Uncharacterized protein BP5553_02490 [Venustampulla echinocandica]RDL42511.1 Uncharacterized protein BP5553_02490 [Venustampulla echinocandica]